MSEQKRQQRPGGGGFGHGAALMMAGQKAKNFKGTLWRLLAYLKPLRLQLSAVLLAPSCIEKTQIFYSSINLPVSFCHLQFIA